MSEPLLTPDYAPLAKLIWETSRADEGTISATGANIVAKAILNAVEQIIATRLRGLAGYNQAITDHNNLDGAFSRGCRWGSESDAEALRRIQRAVEVAFNANISKQTVSGFQFDWLLSDVLVAIGNQRTRDGMNND